MALDGKNSSGKLVLVTGGSRGIGLVAGPMSICHACGDDLRAALPLAIPILDQKSFLQTVEFLKSLESNHRGSSRFGFSFHAILHQHAG
jgi:hypothetical protein